MEDPGFSAGDEAAQSADQPGCGLGLIALALLVLVIAGVAIFSGGDDDSGGDSTPGEGLRACPDYLKVAGPYRQGIDPEYDPAMDWDGDGVSCE